MKLGGRMERHMMNVPSSVSHDWPRGLFPPLHAAAVLGEALYVVQR